MRRTSLAATGGVADMSRAPRARRSEVGGSISSAGARCSWLLRLRSTPLIGAGNFRNALAKIAGRCKFLFVDARRVWAGRCARAEAGWSPCANDDHLVDEHRLEGGHHRDLLPIGNRSAGGKCGTDFILHFEVSVEIELEQPVIKKRLHFARHVSEIHR